MGNPGLAMGCSVEYNNKKALRGYEQTRDKEVTGIQWQLPPPGWVRLNTDGTAKVEDGVVGCGGMDIQK
ncbi:hypothetical protein L195_g008777 [Trifolium pratense]|uniref:Uncharacterized protein n=1 Tax=Trifolium pratense TaxID=57577 RepID=A0A2K3PA36_TRIPR|nr:hypothetical protein L195_g008777 [Trifolium pratense]